MSGHTMVFNRSVQAGGDAAIVSEVTKTSGGRITFDEECPQSATTLIAFAVTAAKIKGVFIKSDKVALLETNDAGTPDDSFSLAAGGSIDWAEGDAEACPITTDIATGIHVTLGAVGTARIQGEILYDPT